jgi:hypothetical protein
MIEMELFEHETTIDVRLHYFFSDSNLHSMDADIFNNCERQFIDAIKSIKHYIDDDIAIEVYAKKEGGIIDTFQIILGSSIVIGIVKSVIENFFKSKFRPTVSISQEVVDRLGILQNVKDMIKTGNISSDEYDYIANCDKGLKKLKSNFFSSAKKEKRISQIEVKSDTPIENKSAIDAVVVPYSQFDEFILIEESDNEDISIREIEEKIYIIAPVLTEGYKNVSWKGFCNEQYIEFKVSDKQFLENVYNHTYKFENGSFITCKMQVTEKIINNITKSPIREVTEISKFGQDNDFVKIEKPKTKQLKDNTPNLFSDMGDY